MLKAIRFTLLSLLVIFATPTSAMQQTKTSEKSESSIKLLVSIFKKYIGTRPRTAQEKYYEQYGIKAPARDSFLAAFAKKLSFSNIFNWFSKNHPTKDISSSMPETKKYDYLRNLTRNCEFSDSLLDNGAGVFQDPKIVELSSHINRIKNQAQKAPIDYKKICDEHEKKIERLTQKRAALEFDETHARNNRANDLKKIEDKIVATKKDLSYFKRTLYEQTAITRKKARSR